MLIFGILRAPGNRVEAPQFAAGARVEATHRAVLHVYAPVVADSGADDDDVSHDRGWRGDTILPLLHSADPDIESNRPLITEVITGLAGPGVERNEAGVHGAEEDSAVAGLLIVANPVCHSPRDEPLIPLQVEFDPGIVAPQLAPATRLQRNDPVQRGAEVEPVLRENGSCLELAGSGVTAAAATLGSLTVIVVARIPGAIGPRDL